LVRGRDLGWLSFMLSKGARPDMASNDGTDAADSRRAARLDRGRNSAACEGAPIPISATAVARRRSSSPFSGRDLPMVRLLHSGGANPNQTDNVAGYSAIDYARQDRRAAAILSELE
jgi:hypothetical protein